MGAFSKDILLDNISNACPNNPMPESLHKMALDMYRKFLIVGGMPRVVANYVQKGSLLESQRILDQIIVAYIDDFAKYKKRVSVSVLREVFYSVVRQNGGKFVYTKVSSEMKIYQIKQALEMLEMAGLIFSVTHTDANGIPIGAEQNTRYKKYMLLDTAIFQRILGLQLSDILLENDFKVINKGAIAELSVGLELIKSASCYTKEQLFYWQREAKNSNAEIDFVIQREREIIPIEVKAGTRGAMQSMYLFLDIKNKKKGIRISQENFSSYDKVDVYPLYAVSSIK